MKGKIQIFLLAMVGFTACEKWSSPPTDFSANMKVYFTPARNDVRTLTLYGVCDTLIAIAGARYGGAQEPVGEVVASFTIGHDSLVEAYNKSNGTEYLPFPEGVVTLPQATAVIPATGFASPALRVRINDGGRLKLYMTYLLPVQMTNVTGAVPIDNDYTTAYVAFVRRNMGTWKHGQWRLLHEHTDESVTSIPIVIVGDGFAAGDLAMAGKYELECEQLRDKFLSNPIIQDFKSWFDVYMVVAESPVSGIDQSKPEHYGIFSSGDTAARTEPDFAKANQLAVDSVPGLAAKPSRSFIFVGNGNIGSYAKFGPTADGMGWGIYSTAEGISSYWMAHVFVGHAFASLADEYTGEGELGGPDTLRKYQAKEMLMNVSYTDNKSSVPWKDFFGQRGYGHVDVIEGGFGEKTGIWRPEEWSTMKDDRDYEEGDEALYYTAQSRWILYQTIHRRAGKSYTFADFLEYDKAYNVR
jgi:hypothetical protein